MSRDPLERRDLDVLDPFPGLTTVFRLARPDDGLGQRIVARIPGAPDRRLDAGFGRPRSEPARLSGILGQRTAAVNRPAGGCELPPHMQFLQIARFTRPGSPDAENW
jgi:hypothetical protein